MSSNVTRICVEKILPHHQSHYDKIKDNGHLSAAFFKSKLWKAGSTIKVGFLDNPSPTQPRTSVADMKRVGRRIDPLQKELANTPLKEAVKTVIAKRIQPLVNLKFVFVSDDKAHDADVRISFADENASWSLVGTDAQHHSTKGSATMNLGWFDVGTYIHEFGHVLGMIHEHQNPRGKVIDWDVPKVEAYMKETQGWDEDQVKTNVLNRYKKDQINGSKFDPLSVMLYFFPAKLTLNHEGSKQNFSLSGIDSVWISKNYPGGDQSPATFYPKAYGVSLKKSIQESNDLRNVTSGGKSHVLLYVLIGVGALVMISGLIIWLVLRKRKR